MAIDVGAGILLIAGTVVAWTGLFSKLAQTIYGPLAKADRLDERIAYIESHRGWWHAHNLLFAAGALIVAAGLFVYASGSDEQRGPDFWVALLAGVGAFFGAFFAVQRTTADVRAWYDGRAGGLTFLGYTFFTLAAFIAWGVALVPLWPGIFLLAWSALLLAVLAWLRDLPPFTHFVGALVVGFWLVA